MRSGEAEGGAAVDAVVIGAGAWGLAAAAELASRGAAVLVADDGGPSAAHVAAGMLAPWSEAEEGEDALSVLLRRAAAEWPAFSDRLAAASGQPGVHEPCGTLLVAARPQHMALVRRHRDLVGRGSPDGPPTWRTGSDLRDLEPGLGPDVGGGVLLADEHRADPRALLAALGAACDRLGVRRAGAATALVREGGRVVGVALGDGPQVRCDAVVLAAGWACSALAPVPAVRPVKGEVLVLGPRRDAPCPVVRVVRSPGVYLVPRRDGRLVVGATQDDAPDVVPTAGGALDLLEDAARVAPGIRGMALLEHVAGRRPMTRDAQPVLGRDPDGLVWATGGFRHGVLLAPVAARAVADAVLGAPPDPVTAPFVPAPGVAA